MGACKLRSNRSSDQLDLSHFICIWLYFIIEHLLLLSLLRTYVVVLYIKDREK